MSDGVLMLTAGEKFHLGVLCEDYEEVMGFEEEEDERQRAAIHGRMVRFMVDRGIGHRHFSERDQDDYKEAYFASVLASHPKDFVPGSWGYDILVAAGLALPALPWPAWWQPEDESEQSPSE